MSFASRLRRGLASALAAVALLSAAARPVLACEMATADHREADAPAAQHDAHAHHGAPAQPSVPDAPQDLGCDHLVGCVSMVVITAPVLSFASPTVPDLAPQSVAASHDAPVRALEPPPPRR